MLNDVKRAPSADAARLGEPSYVWRSGQERRLQLIRRYIPLEGRRILDVGCGIGTYVRRFRDFRRARSPGWKGKLHEQRDGDLRLRDNH